MEMIIKDLLVMNLISEQGMFLIGETTGCKNILAPNAAQARLLEDIDGWTQLNKFHIAEIFFNRIIVC